MKARGLLGLRPRLFWGVTEDDQRSSWPSAKASEAMESGPDGIHINSMDLVCPG